MEASSIKAALGMAQEAQEAKTATPPRLNAGTVPLGPVVR